MGRNIFADIYFLQQRAQFQRYHYGGEPNLLPHVQRSPRPEKREFKDILNLKLQRSLLVDTDTKCFSFLKLEILKA